MKTKKCSKCRIVKLLSDFNKDKSSSDGYMYTCKACKKFKMTKFYRTKIGIVKMIYAQQIRSSRHRGHNLPDYTLEELMNWIYSQPNWEYLYKNWVESGYDKWLKPSIDRLEDSIGYRFSNIRLTTWKENNEKSHADMISCKTPHPNTKKITQLDLKGNFIRNFNSISEASRETKTQNSNIFKVCTGKRNSAGGFKWKYKEDYKP